MEDETFTPTLNDIADAAGVSVASVSKVLNNRPGIGAEKRQKVLAVAKEMGYARNHRLGAGLSGTVAVIAPASFYSNSPFYEEIIRALLEEAAALCMPTHALLVTEESESAATEVVDLLEKRSPGAILLIGLDYPAIIDRLADYGAPTVLVNGVDRTMRLNSVLPDNKSAGWLATRRLLEAGHTEILHVSIPHRHSLRSRLEGFREALEEAGIPFETSRHLLDLHKEGFTETQIAPALERSIRDGRLERVTALFCCNDLMALGAMQTFQSLGWSVPQDFSIIGIDDLAITRHSQPPLSTLRIDRRQLARSAVALLRQAGTDPDHGVCRIGLGVRLMNRETIGVPRHGALHSGSRGSTSS